VTQAEMSARKLGHKLEGVFFFSFEKKTKNSENRVKREKKKENNTTKFNNNKSQSIITHDIFCEILQNKSNEKFMSFHEEEK
jgi:hypothetical protein